MDEYLVFLSSPTDVRTERDRAGAVVKRLNAERVDRSQFKLERWEDEYYSAVSSFQDQIVKPADCQIVICIFWQRLGTELAPKYARPDGTIPTGSEYEFENALEAASGRPEKLPDIFVYRKTAKTEFANELDEPEKNTLERNQYERFKAFWQRWFRSEKGHFIAAFESFADPDDFEKAIERDLRAWLRDRKSEILWNAGSPYRGLEPFDVEHAPIFFGRRREVERTRARLVATAIAGYPFLLITGASGSGKSSLARAGLIPRLRQTGGLSALADSLRWAIVTPGQIAGDWTGGLARALFAKEALAEELKASDFRTVEDLGSQLLLANQSAVLPFSSALTRAGQALARAEGRDNSPAVALLILVDQFEEIFAWPKTDAEAFLRLLKTLSDRRELRILIVATMRSDFQHRLAEFATLDGLTGRTEVKDPEGVERSLELGFPSLADLKEMIVNPARAAGLRFEASNDGERDLAQMIELDARPEAMPAVQLLLSELYKHKNGDLLTLAAHDDLHGVTGVMAQLGEEAFTQSGSAAQAAFPRVVRALVSQVSADAPPTARRTAESTFAGDAEAVALIERLKQARLVISDRGELRFTHDSLLTGWARLKDQISKERRLYGSRELVERLCREWADPETGRKASSHLLEGFPLAEGRQLLAEWGKKSLADKLPELPAFIAASDHRDRLRSSAKYVAVAAAVALIAVAVTILERVARDGAAAKIEASVSSAIARSRADLRDNNTMSAIKYAHDAFQIRPSGQSRSTLAAALLDVSPRLVATFNVGTEVRPALTWLDRNTVAYVTAKGFGEIRTIDVVAPREGPAPAFPMPELTGNGNAAGIVVMRALSPERMTAVYSEGTLAVMERGAVPRVYKAQTGSLPGPYSAGLRAHGSLIATVNFENGNVVATECSVGPPPEALGCGNHPVSGVNGNVVAVNPDETRFAVGDQSGAITVYDRAGNRVGEPIPIGGQLSALDWSSRDQLAVATQTGDVTIVNVASPNAQVKQATQVNVSSLAWSGDGKALAFGCGSVVCLWLGTSETEGAVDFAPIQRLDGHSAAVTRVEWSPDGAHIASLSSDGTIGIWSLAQNRDVSFALYAENPAQLSTVAVSPDGRWVAAGDGDGNIRIWDPATTKLLRVEKPENASAVESLVWNKTGVVVACLQGGTVTLVASDIKQSVRRLNDSVRCESRIAFAEGDRSLAITQRGTKQIVLAPVPVPESRPVRTIGPLDGEPYGIASDDQGAKLFVAYNDGIPRIADVATKDVKAMKPIGQPDNHSAGSLSLSTDGKWLASSGGDRFVRIYDIPAKAGAEALVMEQDEPNVVAFSPDGSKLAALGTKNRLYVWSRGQGASERFAVIDAALARPLIVGTGEISNNAGWMAWLTSDSIAVATGSSAIRVIGLDATKWARRITAIAPREMQP